MPLRVDGRLASVTDPGTWTTFEAASASTVGDGLGLVLTGDGLGCIDLDDAFGEDGRLSVVAERIIADHPDALMVEVSPSGTGVHVWDRMAPAPGRRFVEDGQKVEVYSRARYVTVTGAPLPSSTRRGSRA